ncbi:MAG: DUF4169 family protein [Hyphomicrobiales bacterium]
MADIVNLRTVRKRAKRQQEQSRAAENRLAHGQPKEAQQLDDARLKKARRDLEQHRIEPGDRR